MDADETPDAPTVTSDERSPDERSPDERSPDERSPDERSHLRSDVRSRVGLELLADAGRLLTWSLDYETTLRSLARLAVPRLADWCAIEMRSSENESSQLEVAHVDPNKVQLARQLRERYPSDPESNVGLPFVLRTGRSELHPELSDELLARSGRSPGHLAIIQELGLRSAMIVPLTARGRVLGAITLVSAESGRRYDGDDLVLAEELAARAALAVDNARLYREAQDEIARRTAAEAERAQAEQQLALILGGVGDGITAQDPAGRLVYGNDAAALQMGFESAAALMSTPVSEILARFEILHPDGTPMARSALASTRARDSGSAGEQLVRFRVRETNEERWSFVRSTPVLDDDGTLRMVINFFRDVTREHRARERERLLADATAELGRSLDAAASLSRLCERIVPQLADWCAAYVLDGDRIVSGLADRPAGHRPGDGRASDEAASDGRASDEPSTDEPAIHDPSKIRDVVLTGRSERIASVGDASVALGVGDPAQARALADLGPASLMIVPMIARGRVLGALALASARRRHLDEDDLALAEELARRAGIALDNARLYAQAQEAIRRRDEFLSIASHELRTPLTSIELTLGGLLRAAELGRLPPSPEKLATFLGPARRQLGKLTQLIEQLLDGSRVVEGRLTIEASELDLAELAREVAARMQHDAERAGVTIVVDAPLPVVGLWDRHQLDQVITNLSSNALKYGASGGLVRVRVGASEERAQLSVADRGPGIAPADLARIFGRFERAASTNVGGMGLGLFIVKQIIEAHGGEVRVESTLGVGSEFVADLPLQPRKVHAAHDHDRG